MFVDTQIFKDNNRNTIRGEFKILVTPGKVQVFEEWLESFDNSLKIVDVKDTKVESEIPKHSLPVTGSPELPNHLTSLKSHMHTHHVDEQANYNSAMDSNHLQLDVAANAEHSMSSHDIYNLVKTAFSEIAKESNGKLEQLINSGAKIDIKPESRFDLIERYTPPNNTQDNLDKLNQLLTKLKQQDSLHHTTQLH